jgi:hypothetical protein
MHHIYRLKKSLYGLKQALKSWYAKMDSYLLFQGFIHCKSDPNVYMSIKTGSLLIIVLYADGLLIRGSSVSTIVVVKIVLHDNFAMTDMGLLLILRRG